MSKKEHYIRPDGFGGYNVFEDSSYDSYDMNFDYFPPILFVPVLIIFVLFILYCVVGEVTGVWL